ncbi:hypothetical protein KAW50_01830 [candidate division WOR-3 bacterium]|nr:hypothetical protein [candidate division WOR-3 bacterium]
MLGFISLLFALQSIPHEGAVARIAPSEGVLITLENTKFKDGKSIQGETRIMKLGDKLRIERTFPGSEEISQVIIWDGKQCRLFMPNHKPQLIPPIRDGLEFIGFKGKVKDEKITWEIDANKLPLKKETRHEVTKYEDYMQIESFGSFPAKIERYRDNRLEGYTELKNVDDEAELSNKLFDPRLVEFTEEAKKLMKEFYPE